MHDIKHYDKDAVNRMGKLVEVMPCPEGAIKKFHLFDWQCFLLSWLVGFKEPDGTRAIQECLVVVPRKAGKSSMLAAFALASMAEPVGGTAAPLALMVGVNDDTARITYEKACSIIHADTMHRRRDKTPRFSRHYGFKAMQNKIKCGKTRAEIKPLTTGARNLEGYTAEMIIIDEISRMPDTRAIETLRSGFGAAHSPQLLMTTTPSDLPFSAYDIELRRALKWLGLEVDGSEMDDEPLADDNYLGLIYAATTDENPGDKNVWEKVQPSYNDIAGMSRQYETGWRKAQADALSMHAFKTRQLCLPERLAGAWITVDDWKATEDPPQLPTREAEWITYIGIDLSDVRDLTAIVVLQIKKDGSKQRLWFECHVPRGSLPLNAEDNTKPMRNDMTQWINDGWVRVHESETINHQLIAARLDELNVLLRPAIITSDQYNAVDDVKRFAMPSTSRKVRTFGKSVPRFTSPIATLTGWVSNKTIAIQKHPVAERHLKNAVLEQGKHGGYILTKPTQTSIDKIDTMDAMLTAIGGWLLTADEEIAGSDDAPITEWPPAIKPQVF